MIKDRYRFKLTESEFAFLNKAIDLLYVSYGNTPDLELKLPIVVLREFKMRLAAKSVFPKQETRVFLKSAEAVAFLMLYRANIIHSNFATASIATTIDRTI